MKKNKLVRMVYGGMILAMVITGVWSGGLISIVMFAIICAIYFAFVLAWELVERAIRKSRNKRKEEANYVEEKGA